MLFAFFSKEKAKKKPIVAIDRVYTRPSKSLGVSYTSVHVLWMVRGLVSQIDPKKELTFWTTSIIVLLKEQSTVYPIIDDRHLIVENSSIITYCFMSIWELELE
jgi:hypothetical protein